MKKNGKTANGMKRSKLSITFYVFAALSALYFLYSVVSTWSYLGSYYASAGLSVTDDLSTAIGYVISGSFSFLITTVMMFGIAVIYDQLCKLNASKCAKDEAKAEKVCACGKKDEKAAETEVIADKTEEAEAAASETAEEALNKLEEAPENEEASETEAASENEENAEEK